MEGFQGREEGQEGKPTEPVDGLQRVPSEQMEEQGEQLEEQGGLCTVALDEWLTDSLATALASGKGAKGSGVAEWQETTLEEYLRERWVISALLRRTALKRKPLEG